MRALKASDDVEPVTINSCIESSDLSIYCPSFQSVVRSLDAVDQEENKLKAFKLQVIQVKQASALLADSIDYPSLLLNALLEEIEAKVSGVSAHE